MVKGTASTASEPVVSTPEPPVSEATPVEAEAQVGGELEVQEPAPVAQEPEKPDIKSLWSELPSEERQKLVADEEWHKKALERAEQSAYDRMIQRQQRDMARQSQANQDLQQTLQNLDTASDDNTRAQAIHGYARNFANREREAQAADDGAHFGNVIQKVFKVAPAEFDVKWLDAQRAAAAEGRRAGWDDLLQQIVGEKYVSKSEASKATRDEIDAMIEEKLGKRLAGQPSPVTLGPGVASGGGTPEAQWVEAGAPAGGPIYDRYMEWRKSLQI